MNIESWKIDGEFFDGTHSDVLAHLKSIYGHGAHLSLRGQQGTMKIYDVLDHGRGSMYSVLGSAYKYDI